MKRGVILVNLYDDSPNYLNQSSRIKAELDALGAQCDIVKNSPALVHTDGDGNIYGGLSGYDFCVYLDKDKYASSMLEKRGMRLFNRHSAIRVCDDKMSTHVALAGNGLKMPATVAGALCYRTDKTTDGALLDYVERTLGLPVIVKACYGSLGKEVYKADTRAQLNDISEKLRHTPHLYQQFIGESAGTDIRVIVIGGKIAAAMKRTSTTDFRSNIELGGKGEPFAPDKELEHICGKAAKILGLDYCGIDILRGADGYYICEVNSNAFFGGIERVTGVNVAKLYAEHIVKSIIRPDSSLRSE